MFIKFKNQIKRIEMLKIFSTNVLIVLKKQKNKFYIRKYISNHLSIFFYFFFFFYIILFNANNISETLIN